jgi:hypothetical protein
LNIYIYGAKDFNKSVSKVLTNANITEGIETINTLSRLKSVIEETPQEVFIIDESKIYQENFLNRKFSFLVPKESVEKGFLDQHGVGDICFHSVEGIVTYLKNRFESLNEVQEVLEEPSSEEIEELDEVTDDTINETLEEVPSYKDSSEIEKIEDIEDFQIQEAISELENKK